MYFKLLKFPKNKEKNTEVLEFNLIVDVKAAND